VQEKIIKRKEKIMIIGKKNTINHEKARDFRKNARHKIRYDRN